MCDAVLERAHAGRSFQRHASRAVLPSGPSDLGLADRRSGVLVRTDGERARRRRRSRLAARVDQAETGGLCRGCRAHPSLVSATISAVWLTMNPNLGASARSLQDWVLLSEQADLSISVVLQHDGDLKRWLQETRVPHLQDPMYWPDRRRVLLSALHALKLKRWMK